MVLLGRGSQRSGGREMEATAVTCTTTGSFYRRDSRAGSWVYSLGRETVQRVSDEDDEGMKDSLTFGWVSHSFKYAIDILMHDYMPTSRVTLSRVLLPPNRRLNLYWGLIM